MSIKAEQPALCLLELGAVSPGRMAHQEKSPPVLGAMHIIQ